ncbi:hypothetical protein PHLH4_27360 [Pseudomonas sp. St316]|nr:hypothetical protein PHLH4_27360 [Pseudomonas sp. St316]
MGFCGEGQRNAGRQRFTLPVTLALVEVSVNAIEPRLVHLLE